MKSAEEIQTAIDSLSRADQVELLQRLQKKIRPTCFELTRDIFEELERHPGSGLGDLSTNKKYMEDFGKSKRKAT
jgi:hypothetical protein